MSPVELSFTLDGVFQKKITAADGVMALLETPAGTALAKFLPNGRTWLTREAVIDRLGVKFPEDPEYLHLSTRGDGLHYNINSLFDFIISKERRLRAAKKVTRVKKIQTHKGLVEIKAVGYDAKNSQE